MPTLLILMIVAAMAFAFWSAGRAAAERAEHLGRNACQAAGVQWLDQTVHASGLRLHRGEDGRLGFERSFRFEYSYDTNRSPYRQTGVARRAVGVVCGTDAGSQCD